MSDIDKRVIEWESELVQHQAEQYRKIQDYERLAAENARLREALQAIIDDMTNFPGYMDSDSDAVDIARAALD